MTPLIGRVYRSKEDPNSGWYMVLGKTKGLVFICGVFHDIHSMYRAPHPYSLFSAKYVTREEFSKEYERTEGPMHPRTRARYDKCILEIWSDLDE